MAGPFGTLATPDIQKNNAAEPLADGMGLGCKKCWTGGEAGAFDCLPMGLANDRTNKRKRNTGRDSSAAVGQVTPRSKAE